ncbi:hypothetical protein AHAS_Ahas17G0229200 [Arachis hypogaea]
MKRVKWSIRVKPLQRELIGHVGVKLWSVNRVAERMITKNVHTSPNLRSYYIKPMLYYILVYIGRVHLVNYNSGLHLKGRKKRGNELICRFRPAPDAIRLASQIRHSSGITSARSQPLAGADSPAEALILQLKHVPLSPGSHSIYTDFPV